jgi:hypothetical protein
MGESTREGVKATLPGNPLGRNRGAASWPEVEGSAAG